MLVALRLSHVDPRLINCLLNMGVFLVLVGIQTTFGGEHPHID